MWWRRRRNLFSVLLAAWIAAGCSSDGSDESAGDSGLADEIITGFTTIETDSGKVKWRLGAPTARRFNTRQVFIMERPTIEFFDPAGRLETTLVSESGEYSQETHDMLAYGNVVVTSVAGDVLETDSLRYLNSEDKIVSDCFVKLTRGNDVITGYGLEADNTLSSVDIKRDVNARIVDDGDLDGDLDG